jgi:hypothetical protein
LDKIIAGKLLVARGVYGFWPASSVGDDIVVHAVAPTAKRGCPRPHQAAVPLEGRFREFLSAHKQSLTRDRQLVLNAVATQPSPFDAERIVDACGYRQGRPRVSRGAVAQTLDLLEQATLIRRTGGSNGSTEFQLASPLAATAQAASAGAPNLDLRSEISDLSARITERNREIADHPSRIIARFPMLRQQWEREGQKDFRSLADYIAPREAGRQDYLGAFAVTAGIGCDELAARFDAEHDEYNSIMTKALADRLAEAFAEYLHHLVRTEVWRYERPDELSGDKLIAEEYRGIRPAFGYPACPDHLPKSTLWKLLDPEHAAGIRLTESYAMWPAASVSGLYFAHPQARYFAVDRITRDQVESYAARMGLSVAEVERWLAPNLGYDN